MTEEPETATVAHAAILAAVHATAFPPRERWAIDTISLQLALPGVVGFLHPRGGMLLARVIGDEAEILTLAVEPRVRRQGVATALLTKALAETRSRGARSVLLEVSISNAAARALYGHAGFVEVGRRRRYYADGADALILRAELPA
jgi:[ribosomal protein S18]-alanine N-acetyltransferase